MRPAPWIRRITTALMASAVLMVAALPPLILVLVTRAGLERELEAQARIQAALITRTISRYPGVWGFAHERLIEGIADFLQPDQHTTLLDASGAEMVESGRHPSTPFLERRAAFHEFGLPVGSVSVSKSLRPALVMAAGLGAVSSVIAVILAGLLLRWRRVEDELARSEEKYRSMVDSLEEIVFRIDAEGRWTFVNPAWGAITGFGLDDTLESELVAYVVSEDRARAAAVVRDAIERGEPIVREAFRWRTAGGGVRCFEMTARPETDESGACVALAGILSDVTPRKQWEDGMVLAKEAAEAASRAKGEFLANMSHEIRTPMNGIIGMTELALDTPLDPTQRRYLETVRESAGTLLTIINDILDFSKVEAGRLDIESVVLDPRRLVTQTLEVFGPRTAQKQLRLGCRIESDVPQQVRGDPTRIRQVLWNLLDNAIKFTPYGSITVEVTAEPSAGPGTVLRFAVRDTGIGVAPDKRQAIFEPFAQGDSSTTRRYGGTGLGLTISRRLTELMGGAMGFSSEPGRGSTFWFTVRTQPVATSEPAAAETWFRGDRSALAEEGLNILLAEDNDVNQAVARAMLERLGHRVTTTGNGRAALEAYERGRGRFDLLLLDVQMPELSGLEVAARIRAIERGADARVPIIALTAGAMSGDRERCLSAGMDDFLAKPVTMQSLQAALAGHASPRGASGRAARRA